MNPYTFSFKDLGSRWDSLIQGLFLNINLSKEGMCFPGKVRAVNVLSTPLELRLTAYVPSEEQQRSVRVSKSS